MGIDLDREIGASHFLKWMAVGKLRVILDQLRDDDELYPVGTGNLTIYRGGEAIGFIDMAAEGLELFS
jgi:hypothetical protein